MRRINLPLLLDSLFAAICAFLLFFTAIRYYTRNAAIALTFAILAFLLFGALCFVYIRARQGKKLLSARDEREKRLLSLHLSLSADNYVLNLFKNCLGEGSYMRGGKVISGDDTCFFNFKMSAITEDDVAKIIKFKGKSCKNKKLYCTKISPEAAVLAKSFLIETVCIDEVYNLLKHNNLLPEKYLYEEIKKPAILKRIKATFSRKLCAPLFWSGAALLALSYFTFFPIYYIVSGGIMLVLSAVALAIN